MLLAMFLTSLLQDIPEEEFDAAATILPTHHTPLSTLHSSDKYMQVGEQVDNGYDCELNCTLTPFDQMWCSFSSRTEEEQQLITRGGGHCVGPCSINEQEHGQSPVARPTPKMSFKKINSRIRAVLQHNKHLPRVSGQQCCLMSTPVIPQEMLDELEEELRFFLTLDPHRVVLVLQTSP